MARATAAAVLRFDLAINRGEPIRSEQRPAAERLAVEVDYLPGEDPCLPVIRQMIGEARGSHFRDESGRGIATLLERGRQRGDDRLGGLVAPADVLAALSSPPCGLMDLVSPR